QLVPAGNDVLNAMVAMGLADLAVFRGESHLALSYAQRTLDLAARTGDLAAATLGHWTRGRAQNRLRDFEGALRSLEQALATGGMLTLEASFLASMAVAQLGLGDHDRAGLAAVHAIEVARQRGHAISECEAHLALARVLAEVEGARAEAAIEAALQASERLIA